MNRRPLAFGVAAGLLLAACGRQPQRPERTAPAGDPLPAARPPAAPAAADPALPPAPVPVRPAVVFGVVPAAVNDVPSAVVLRPATAYAYPTPTAKPMMDQMARRFTPDVLVVRTGQPADFRNDDDTIHNVRVRERGRETDDPAFNIALPQGASYDYAFAKDAVWDVRCDMHQSMSAVVISSSSPYAAVAGRDGSFEVGGLPAGAYTLIAYTAGGPLERAIHVAEGQRLRVNLAAAPARAAR